MKAGIFPWISILAAVWSTTACFNPKVPEGVACSTEGECPAGQTCDPVDNRCYSVLPDRDPDAGDGPPPDGPTKPDANDGSPPPDAPPDVTPPDAPPPDATVTPPPDASPACQNQMRDGQETDMDCGGPDCLPCAPGRMCMLPRDCTSQVCGGNQLCAAPECGDGVVNQPTETCDNGTNNSDVTPNACRTSCQPASCGDGVVDTGEEADGTDPSTSVPVNPDTCRYDFSAMRQLSCNNACGIPWNNQSGCQRTDADVLCKLVTGNPASTVVDASSFNVQSPLNAPGVCCPPPAAELGTLGCIPLGRMNLRGVDVEVSVHDTDMRSTHGTGAAVTITSAAVCTNP